MSRFKADPATVASAMAMLDTRKADRMEIVVKQIMHEATVAKTADSPSHGRNPTAPPIAANATTKASPTRYSGAGMLRGVLSNHAPGSWSSDHRAESEHYTGWNYVAIRAVALQFAQAGVNCYQDQDERTAGRRFNFIKKSRSITVAKSGRERIAALARLKADYNLDNDDSALLEPNHPLVKLLRRPNKRTSGGMFRMQLCIQLSLTGRALVWNVPNRAGLTVERWVIPTSIATPMRPTQDHPFGYFQIQPELSRYYDDSGPFMSGMLGLYAGAEVPAQHVQIYEMPHPVLLDDGQSPLAAGALWTDSDDMLHKRRWSHLKNGARPSSIITYGVDSQGNTLGPENDADLERLEQRFNKKYSGTDNDGATMFVTGGADVTPLGHTAVEMDYVNSAMQLREAILALHGTPPIAVGLESPSGRDGLYAPLMQWTFLNIQPQLDLIAEQDSIALAPQFGSNITVEYEAATIDDSAPLEEQIKTDIAAGAMTVDEIRTIRGREVWGGARGEAIAGANANKPMFGMFGQGGGVGGDMAGAGVGGAPSQGGGWQLPGNPFQQSQQGQQGQQEQTPNTMAGNESSATTTTNNDAGGIEAETTLNGAQVTAAVDLLAGVQAGTLAREAAIELLAAVGIPRKVAVSIIAAQQKIPTVEPPTPNAGADSENNGNFGQGGGDDDSEEAETQEKNKNKKTAAKKSATKKNYFRDYP